MSDLVFLFFQPASRVVYGKKEAKTCELYQIVKDNAQLRTVITKDYIPTIVAVQEVGKNFFHPTRDIALEKIHEQQFIHHNR